MHAFIALATQPEAPSRTLIGLVVYALLSIPVLIWGGNKGYSGPVLTLLAIIMAGILSTIPVVNDLGRAFYQFAVNVAQALGAGELVSVRVGVLVGVVLALVGVVGFHIKRTMPWFAFMLVGLWFLLGADWSRDMITQVTEAAVWLWNRIPGVG